MALTGGARAHDLNMGAKAEVVHCSLAPACVRTRAAAAVDAYGRQLRNIWLRGRLIPRMEATNE